ncbi:hypothetical protein U0C82_10870 [Fulvimarina sp. 2208YS6-2-32]|uniref:Uncharacterized protein n=1 Tax=Fulvimarina uroteuthidis TaxID=3098149 RepID=A0ABU5I2P4_9HYPH|nr:hypothetical protein [Fulvimarina sp. 2208YS6-2-32]MDY8109639.1 hypothetical protein [Fulvimarina sp. 2208YS6-2-32]
MSNPSTRYETSGDQPGIAVADPLKPLDKSARLAVEAGPGHGFYKAMTDMANANVDGLDPRPAEQPDAGSSLVGLIEQVGVDDLAFAAKDMKVKRLVVVTPFGDPASLGTVLTLARLLTEDNHPVALIQLDGNAPSPVTGDEDGDTRAQAGWIDLLGGGREVADIIHRDPHSRLHVAPSGGVDTEALEEDQLEDLAFYLGAFNDAYAMNVIHAPIESLKRLSGLNDGETAVIVAAAEDRSADVEALAHDLNAATSYDVLHLTSEADMRILH